MVNPSLNDAHDRGVATPLVRKLLRETSTPFTVRQLLIKLQGKGHDLSYNQVRQAIYWLATQREVKAVGSFRNAVLYQGVPF